MRRASRRKSRPARKPEQSSSTGFRAPSAGSLLSALAGIVVLVPVAVMAFLFLRPDPVSSADELLWTGSSPGALHSVSGEIDWGTDYRYRPPPSDPPLRPGQQGSDRPSLVTAPSQIRVSEVVGVQILAAPASGTPMVTVTSSNGNISLGDGCSGNVPNSVTREDYSVIFLVGCNEGQTTLTLSQAGASNQAYSINVVARPVPDDTATPVPTVVGYPLNLTATPSLQDSSRGQVSLTWQAPEADTCQCLVPTSWKLEFESVHTVRADHTLSSATNVTITDLRPGTTYTFYLRGINGPRFSEWTSVSAVTPGDPPETDPGGGDFDAVGLPAALTASPTDDTLFVSWTAPTAEACNCLVPDNWHVEFEGPDGQRRNAGTVPAGTTRITLRSLVSGSPHTVYVRGVYRSVRVSPWVSVTESTTGDAPGETDPDTAAQLPVGRPGSLLATPTAGSDTSIDASWTSPDADACACAVPTEWQVEYEDGQGHRRAWGVTTGNSVTIASLDPGSSYTVFVRGLVGARVGAWFSYSTTTTGLPPNLVNATGSPLDPLRPVTYGDARLLVVPSQLRVGEVQGVQPIGTQTEGEPPPNITLTVSSASIVSLGDGCSSPQQEATVVSGAVVYLIGCAPGLTNLALTQSGGSATTYQIRVVDRPEYPTPEPVVVGYAQGFSVTPLDVASGATTAGVMLSWRIPTCGDGECWRPDLWKVEYESADTVRRDHNFPVNTTSVNINGLLPGTVYTFHIRGIYEPRSLFGEWISKSAVTRGDPPQRDAPVSTVTAPALAPDPVGLAVEPELAPLSDASEDSLRLTWSAPDADNCDCVVPERWQIEYEDDDGFRRAHDVVGASATGATITELDPGTAYTVYIRGLAGSRLGGWLSASARTSGERETGDGDTVLATTDVVGFPANFRVTALDVASADTDAGVRLTWEPPDADACDCRMPQHWQIQYESGGTVRGDEELQASTTSLIIRDLLPGTIYTFYIRGVAGARVSAWISRTTATNGDPPDEEDTVVVDDGRPVGLARNLSVTRDTAASTTALVFSWDDPDAASCECRVPDRWQIEYEDDDGFRRGLDVVASGTNSVPITGLSPGTTYNVYIRGLAGARLGGWLSAGRSTSGRMGGDTGLDPNRPITLGDARLLVVPSQLRVGEVQGVQPIGTRSEDEPPPNITLTVSSPSIVSLGDGCSSPQQEATVVSGAVVYLIGCAPGITNLTLTQNGGSPTTYQIRVVDRPEYPTPEPNVVGYARGFRATPLDVASGATTAGVMLSWRIPTCGDGECWRPDLWKVEYESADTVRRDHNFPVDTTSVTITGLLPGTVYTFHIRGIYEPRSLFGEWISISATTNGEAPEDDGTTGTFSALPVGRPVGLAAEAASSTPDGLRVTWSAPSDEGDDPCECLVPTLWQLEYEISGTGGRFAPTDGPVTTTSVNLSGLLSGTNYNVYVRGLLPSGATGAWASVRAQTAGTAPADHAVPAIPVGTALNIMIEADLESPSTGTPYFDVGWVRPLDRADIVNGFPDCNCVVPDSWQVEYEVRGVRYAYSATIPEPMMDGVISIKITDLLPGARYTVWIRGLAGARAGAWVGATQWTRSGIADRGDLPVGAAKNIAQAASETSARIQWDGPDSDCNCLDPASWQVEYHTEGLGRFALAGLTAASTETVSATIRELRPGSRHSVFIRGVRDALVGPWRGGTFTTSGDPPDTGGGTFTTRPVGLPASLTATSSGRTISVSWSDPEEGCDCDRPEHYQLEIEAENGARYTRPDGPVSAEDDGNYFYELDELVKYGPDGDDMLPLRAGVIYTVHVRGISGQRAGEWVSATTRTGGVPSAGLPVGMVRNMIISSGSQEEALHIRWDNPSETGDDACDCVRPEFFQLEYHNARDGRHAARTLLEAASTGPQSYLLKGLRGGIDYTVFLRGVARSRAGEWVSRRFTTAGDPGENGDGGDNGDGGSGSSGGTPVCLPEQLASEVDSDSVMVLTWEPPPDDATCVVPDSWQVEYEDHTGRRFAVSAPFASGTQTQLQQQDKGPRVIIPGVDPVNPDDSFRVAVNNLRAGVEYTFYVRGVNDGRVSEWDAVSRIAGLFSNNIPPPVSCQVTTAPDEFNAGRAKVVLQWDRPPAGIPDGDLSFRIERAQTRNAAFSRIISGIPRILWVNQVDVPDTALKPKTFMHTVRDLDPGRAYTWRILTVVDGRASSRFCVLDDTTDPLHTPTPLPVGTCFPPQGFQATANERISAKLGWTDPTGAPPNCVVDGYVVGWARGALDRHFLGGPAVDWQDRSLSKDTMELTYTYQHDMRYHVTAIFRIKALYQGGNESRWVYAFLPLPDVTGNPPPSLLARGLRISPQPPGGTVRLGWQFYQPAIPNPYFVVEEWSSIGMRWTPAYHGQLPNCDPSAITPLNTPVPTPTPTPGTASQTLRGISGQDPGNPDLSSDNFYCLLAIDLLPNVDYQWRVRVYYELPAVGVGAPQSQYGPWANFAVYSYGGGGTDFPPPENVRLASPTQNRMNLAWEIPEIPVGETLLHFIVELRGIFPEADEVEPWRSPTGSSTITPGQAGCEVGVDDVCGLTLTGLFTETSYEVRVRIVYMGGESRWVVATATTLSPTVLPPVDPYISSPAVDSLLLKWTEPLKEASVQDMYWIRVKGFYEEDISDENFRIVARDLEAGDGSDGVCAGATPGGRACEHRIGDLQSDAVYQVEVRRVVSNLGSRWVRTAGRTLDTEVPLPVVPTSTSTTTPTPTSTPTRPPNFINAPKIETACDDNAAYDSADGTIRLEWSHDPDDPAGGADADHYEVDYRVVVNHRPGPWIQYGSVDSMSTSIEFRGVVRGEDYAFRVTAVALASADHPELRTTSVSCLVTTEDAVLPGTPTTTPTPTTTFTPDPSVPFIHPPVFDCGENGDPALTYDNTNMANAIKLVWDHTTSGVSQPPAPGTTFAVGAAADYFEVDYRIWTNGRPGQWTSLSATSAEMLTYRGVVAGEGYDFRVTAVSRANLNRPELRATSLPCFIMPDGDDIPEPTPSAIPTPANFQVIGWESEALTLGWDPPPDLDTENITGYELRYREVKGGTDWLIPLARDIDRVRQTPPQELRGIRVVVPADDNRILLTWDQADGEHDETRFDVRYHTDRNFPDDPAPEVIRNVQRGLVFADGHAGQRRYLQVMVAGTLTESPWAPSPVSPLAFDMPPIVNVPQEDKRCFSDYPADAPMLVHAEADRADDGTFTVEWKPPTDVEVEVETYVVDWATDLNFTASHHTAQVPDALFYTTDEELLLENTRYYLRVGYGESGSEVWSCVATVFVQRTLASPQSHDADNPAADLQYRQRVPNLKPETTYEFQLRAITTWGVENTWAYTVGTTLAEGEDDTLEPPTPAPTLPGVVQPPLGCEAESDRMGLIRVRVIQSIPEVSLPDASLPDASLPDASLPDASLPDASIPVSAGPLGAPTHYRIEYRPVGSPDWQTLVALLPAGHHFDHPDNGIVYEYRVFGLVFGANSFTESYTSVNCRSDVMAPARIIPTDPVVGDSDAPASVELGWNFPSLSRIAPTPVFIIDEHVPNSGLSEPWLPVHTDDDCAVVEEEEEVPFRIDRDHCTVFGGIRDGVEYRLAVKAIYFDRILGTYVETPRAYFRPFSYRSRPSGDLTAPLGFAGRDISRNLDDPDPEDIWVLLRWEGSEGADAYQVERLEIYEEAEVVDWVGSTEYRVHTLAVDPDDPDVPLDDRNVDHTFDRGQGWQGLYHPPRAAHEADIICESVYVPDVGDAIWPWIDDQHRPAFTGGGSVPGNFYDDVRPEGTIYKKHANRRPLFIDTDHDLLARNRSLPYSTQHGERVGARLRAVDYDGHQTYFAITRVDAVRGDNRAASTDEANLPFYVDPVRGQIHVRSFAAASFIGPPPTVDEPVVFWVTVRVYDQAGGWDEVMVPITVSNASGDDERTDAPWEPGEAVSVPSRPVATRTPPDDGDEHILFQSSGSTSTPTPTPTVTPTATPTLSDELEGVRLVRQCHVAIGNGDLDGGTTYSFRVYALDAQGNSGPYSETIQVTTRGRVTQATVEPVPTIPGQALVEMYPEPNTMEEWTTTSHELTMHADLNQLVLTTGASGRVFMLALPFGERNCPAGRPAHEPSNAALFAVNPHEYSRTITLNRSNNREFYNLADEEASLGILGFRVCLFAATLLSGGDELQRLSIIDGESKHILHVYEIRILPGTGNGYFKLAPIADNYVRGERYRMRLEFTDLAADAWEYSFTFEGAPPGVASAALPVLISEFEYARETPSCDALDADAFADRAPTAMPGAGYPPYTVGDSREREFCLKFARDDRGDRDTLEFWLSGLTLASADCPSGFDGTGHPACTDGLKRFTADLNIIGGLADRIRERIPSCGDDPEDLLCLRQVLNLFCNGLGVKCDSELFFNLVIIIIAVGIATVPLFGGWATVGEITVLHAVLAYLLLISVLVLGVLLVGLPEYQAAIPIIIATVGGLLVLYGRLRSRT